MTLKYQYKMKKTPYTYGTGRECGPYQCEREDFWRFFNAQRSQIECLIVELEDGRKYIAYRNDKGFKRRGAKQCCGFNWERVR